MKKEIEAGNRSHASCSRIKAQRDEFHENRAAAWERKDEHELSMSRMPSLKVDKAFKSNYQVQVIFFFSVKLSFRGRQVQLRLLDIRAAIESVSEASYGNEMIRMTMEGGAIVESEVERNEYEVEEKRSRSCWMTDRSRLLLLMIIAR